MQHGRQHADGRRRRRFPVAFTLALLIAALLAAFGWRRFRVSEPPPPIEFLWPVTVSTLAGGPTRGSDGGPPLAARFSDPFGIATDHGGFAYVADAGANHAIRRIGPAGIVSVVAGGGEGFSDGRAEQARFRTPSGISFNPARGLVVADTGNHAVRLVGLDGHVSTLAGTGSAGFADGLGRLAAFDGPLDVAWAPDGSIVVADTYNDRIRRIDPAGRVSTIAGGGATGYRDGPGPGALFDTPSGVAVAPDGTIFVADTGNDLVRTIDPAGNVSTLGPTWSGAAGEGDVWTLRRPVGIALGHEGHLYVTDANRVVMFTRRGRAILLAGGSAGFVDGTGPRARFRGPAGISVDRSGRVFIADSENHRVRQLTPAGLAVPARDIDLTPFSLLPRSPAETGRLAWPVDPQDGWHEVTATFGEARGSHGGDGRERLHTGIDVRAKVGALVRAVRDDEVRRPLATSEYEGANEALRLGTTSYVHLRVGRRGRDSVLAPERFSVARGPDGEVVRIRVRRGARFRTGDILGTVNRYAHVHLDIGLPGAEENPLALGLPNFTDSVAPIIPAGGIVLLDENGNPIRERAKGRLVVSGRVSIVVEAFDRVDRNARNRRLAPYSLGWQVLDAGGKPVPGHEVPRITIEMDRLLADRDAPRIVYAEGSGITVYGSPVTRFRFIVTNTVRGGEASEGAWDTSALAPGDYVLRIFAWDHAGNVTRREVGVSVTRNGQTATGNQEYQP